MDLTYCSYKFTLNFSLLNKKQGSVENDGIICLRQKYLVIIDDMNAKNLGIHSFR